MSLYLYLMLLFNPLPHEPLCTWADIYKNHTCYAVPKPQYPKPN